MLGPIPEMETAKVQVEPPPTAAQSLAPATIAPAGSGIPMMRTEQFHRVASRTCNDADAEKLVSLLRQWDTDGDGKFSVDEVMIAARQMLGEKRQSTSLKKWLVGLAVLYLASLAIILALMIGAMELAKDSRPSNDGVLLDTRHSGEVIKVKSKVDNFSPFDYLELPLNQIEQLGVIYLSGLPSGTPGSEDLIERLYTVSRVSRNTNDNSAQILLSDGSILDVDATRAVLYEPILSEAEAAACGKEWILATKRHCAIAIIWNGEERADPVAADRAAVNTTDANGRRRLGLPRVSIIGPQYSSGPRGIGNNINFNVGRVYGNEGIVSLGRNRFFQQGQLRACRGMACAF